jgi:hypothetical protein
VDYQDLTTYLEFAPAEWFSAFVEFPVRFLNPELNANTAGYGDMNAGFKYAFLMDEEQVATLQFRTYAPSGDAARGLGNNHVSLEPGLLYFRRLTDATALSAELRYWIPIGGTDFAGDIIRYGVGIQHNVYQTECLLFTPVVEFVGWTVLSGKEGVAFPSGVTGVLDAEGDTIVNSKLGLRVRFSDWGDMYTGYGRVLTGDRWYEDIFRLEFRLFY